MDSHLIELAGRCERAVGPDRELDCLIAVAVGAFAKRANKKYDGRIDYVDLREPGHETWPGNGGDQFVPDYTASIDAAKTILLDFMSIEMTESAAGSGFTRCWIWDWRRSPTMSDPGNEWRAEGARPLPLNICAAALRARSVAEGQRE